MTSPAFLHVTFEAFAYFFGYALFRLQRNKSGDTLAEYERMQVLVAAVTGAWLGSKLMAWMDNPKIMFDSERWVELFFLGKSIAGGLIGGLIAVECVKKRLGILVSTGDLYAIPLAAGIAIGRIGCFLAGLSDHTYGLPSSLPWAVDFGDGILRHPTQIYELIWMLSVMILIGWTSKHKHQSGDLFKIFMICYFGFRLLIEGIKPRFIIAGLSSIQWASLAVLIYYFRDILRMARRTKYGS